MSRGVRGRLTNAGLSPGEAERKAALFAAAEEALGGAASRYYVPGRIEVLGKHTDYAGGRSLLVAAERGFCAVAEPREDAVLGVVDATTGASLALPLTPDLAPPDAGWGLYAGVVARRLARDFGGGPDADPVPAARAALHGLDLAFASDLPVAAGLSSSSALVTLLVTALADANRLPKRALWRAHLSTPEALAAYLGCVENGYSFGPWSGDRGVGTLGGSEDHTAILACRAGFLSRYRFRPVQSEGEVPMPPGCVFAVAVSGVVAEKSGATREHYNRLALSAAAALEAWRADTRRDDPTLFAAAVSAPDAPARLREAVRRRPAPGFDTDEVARRLDQFLLESLTLIPAASQALAGGDLATFGAVAERSHSAAEAQLGNQIPETSWLVHSARELGAHAASAFGAGFGGSVWALTGAEHASAFLRAWRERYDARFRGAASEFFTTGAGPGLLRL